jgi:hypothetical protein
MQEIIVGKKIMYFHQDGDNYHLDKLFNINKLGTKCFWEIHVNNNKIFRKTYQEGGTIREFPLIEATGKNIGKKNETSDHQQALFQAHTLWTKKQDQGYCKVDQTQVDQTQVDQTNSQNSQNRKSY